jgi:hypothetical protein
MCDYICDRISCSEKRDISTLTCNLLTVLYSNVTLSISCADLLKVLGPSTSWIARALSRIVKAKLYHFYLLVYCTNTRHFKVAVS